MVTLPSVTPLMTIEPSALITTGRLLPFEFKVPNANFTSRLLAAPLAIPPDVATLSWQGLTRTIWPTASLEPAGKVDAVMAKMQEPNVVVPVAVAPPALMANVGEASVLVNLTSVDVVVPSSVGRPAGKVKGTFTTAAAVVDVTAAAVLAVAIDVLIGEEVPPPPQAAKAAETSTVKNNLLALIMDGLQRKVSYWGFEKC